MHKYDYSLFTIHYSLFTIHYSLSPRQMVGRWWADGGHPGIRRSPAQDAPPIEVDGNLPPPCNYLYIYNIYTFDRASCLENA